MYSAIRAEAALQAFAIHHYNTTLNQRNGQASAIPRGLRFEKTSKKPGAGTQVYEIRFDGEGDCTLALDSRWFDDDVNEAGDFVCFVDDRHSQRIINLINSLLLWEHQ